MDYTKKQNIPGILLYIDFEKAYDGVIRWIETLYTNISSCVLNNGLCSPYFEVQRGVRKGDPLSPYLFTNAVEILAIAIQTNKDIHGLQIGKDEFKLAQYADVLTVFVPNIECAKRVFHLLDEFRSCSGLKVNLTKPKPCGLVLSKIAQRRPGS